MFLRNLELKHYRNYQDLQVEFSPQVNIFYGQNAQGKTNLLESISLLCFGKSFRTKKEAELIEWANASCYLKGQFETDDFPITIELGIAEKEKRTKIDGQIVKNTELFGKIPLITFAPDDLQLIKGGPQFRRDFLDLYLALIEPKYRFIYYNYHKILQQRNRLLKEGIRDNQELEVWDEQLVEKGSKVIKYRLAFIENVEKFITKAQHEISGTLENLSIEYLGFRNSVLNGITEEEIISRFKMELNMVKNSERERRVTLIGPNRDDLRLTIGEGVDLRNFGSQGQQRTAALALKLGMMEKIKESRGQYPILLLDDVMSEFDDQRKKQLLTVLVNSSQTFMTSTSKRDFPIGDQNTLFFKVTGGVIERG
jgi:DNA replication and repair protein RecF